MPLLLTLRLLLSVFGCIALFGCESKKSNLLNEDLGLVYEDFRQACQEGDIGSFRKSSSKFTFIDSKNIALSIGVDLEQFLQRFSPMVPQLDGMEELALKQNGETAKLVFFGIPQGVKEIAGAQIVPSYHVIDFLREDGKWKVHEVGGYLPAEIKGGDEAVVSGDHSAVLSNGFFSPTGVIPLVPKEVVGVELQGRLEFESYGFQTRVWINGHDQNSRRMIKDETGGGPVIGGLKSGKNTIRIEVDGIEDASVLGKSFQNYRISLMRVDGNQALEVFTYKPEGLPSNQEISFVVEP